MADTAITATPLNKDVSYRQSQMPMSYYGTYVADDADYHILKVDGRGKAKLTFGATNLSNQDVVLTLYGAHSITAEVGDDGVFAIGSSKTVTATTSDYDTSTAGFPYYLIRAKSASAGDSKNVVLYADFTAF